MREISFHGRSLGVIKSFPLSVKRDVGHQLDRVQKGLEPGDWKPMPQVGKGVKELRVRNNGQFRVLYVAVHAHSVHVLHAFQKKTQKTRLQEIQAAQRAFKEIEEPDET